MKLIAVKLSKIFKDENDEDGLWENLLHQIIMNLRYTIRMNEKNNKQLMNNDFLYGFAFHGFSFFGVLHIGSIFINFPKAQQEKIAVKIE